MLKSEYPEQAKYWNYARNNAAGITFEKTSFASHKKVWWKCEKGHEWESTPHSFSSGHRCPYCSRQKVLPGFNDLATTRKDLLSVWNFEKNDILPSEITGSSSHRVVWWKCKKGHEWESTPNNATGQCPYCSNRRVLPGFNDLATMNPQLIAEWNYERNLGISPQKTAPYSNKKVWWKCKKGHEWEAKPADRSRGNGCPFCSNKKVLPGYNDLATLNPQLLNEWNYDKNHLNPANIVAGSSIKVWWKCKKGHEWRCSPSSRIRPNGSINICPVCSRVMRVSFSEKVLFYYIQHAFPDAVENYRPEWLNKKELDIYIPSKRLGIEYDGARFHKSKRDIKKDKICEEQGITLIHIREKGAERIGPSSSIVFTLPENHQKSGEHLVPGLHFLERQLGRDLDIDLSRDYDEIRSLVVSFDSEKCIARTHPEVLSEWDYEKNDKVGNTPENVTAGAGIDVWWRCEKGHSYKASISDKTRSNPTGCPICASHRVLPGFNDLATKAPQLAKEWDYEKNSDLTPQDILASSGKKFWWKCEKGHSYQATPNNRICSHTGCPYCSSHKLLPGFNDLETKNPRLASEWNYEKNSSLTPRDVMSGSGRKVWWKCEKGHEWQAIILSRNRGNGCPICAKEKKATHKKSR